MSARETVNGRARDSDDQLGLLMRRRQHAGGIVGR